MYLPDKHLYTKKLVNHEHLCTLHGGVGITKTSVRKTTGFQAVAAANPSPGYIPMDQTQGTHPSQVVGIDYSGPTKYKEGGRVEAKAYIVLYSCSLCRKLYLETQDFIMSLKTLIARKGRPQKSYSDHGSIFKFHAEKVTAWQFNISCEPWWGGHFERMVGLVKNALNKTIGCNFLSWKELVEVLLDVEITLNNRPLS